jgi:hypothetical protein
LSNLSEPTSCPEIMVLSSVPNVAIERPNP